MKRRFRWSQERTKALADLRENGTASSRKLAERWKWDRDKVRRFLRFIAEHEAEIMAAYPPQGAVKGGAVKRVLSTPCGAVKAASLDRTTLDKLPLESGGGYTSDLIGAMNRCLSSRFGSGYRPVSDDNRSSVATGQELQAAGVDREWAVMMLQRHAMRFHPEKHGGGKLPGSLKFFKRGLLKAWGLESQAEIPLLTVETPHPLSGVHAYVDPSAHKNLRHPTLLKEAVWGAVLEASEASA